MEALGMAVEFGLVAVPITDSLSDAAAIYAILPPQESTGDMVRARALMNISLTGKAALVTGAGRGIGRAIAQSLAGSGAAVLLTDIDESALMEAKRAIEDASSRKPRLASIAGDLTSAGFPEVAIAKLIAEFGSVDIIVNNAGYTWDNVIQKTTDEQFQAMLDIHVVAPFRVLRAAVPWLRRNSEEGKGDGPASGAKGGEYNVYIGAGWKPRTGWVLVG